MKISRSFARKVDLGHYENCDSFCAIEQELGQEIEQTELEAISSKLASLCEQEVNKSIQKFQNAKEVSELKSKIASWQSDLVNNQTKLKISKTEEQKKVYQRKISDCEFQLSLLNSQLAQIS